MAKLANEVLCTTVNSTQPEICPAMPLVGLGLLCVPSLFQTFFFPAKHYEGGETLKNAK